MKQLSLTLALITLISQISFAGALDTPHRAIRVKNSLATSVLNMNGVNGIGVTGCDPETGKKNIDGDFVHCVVIMTETKEAARALKKLYPDGSKVKGVFVTVSFVGPIEPQPGVTIGN